MDFFKPISTSLTKKNLDPFSDFLFFGPQKIISAQEDMKIKKATFAPLVLEFFLSIKIQLLEIENPKIKPPSPTCECMFLHSLT
jgi:hypothetical protein